MRALTALVIVMGVAILAGLALLAYGLVSKIGADQVGLSEISLPIPVGCRLADSRIEEGRLLIRVDGLPEQGCQQIVILDLESGEVLGRVSAVPDGK